jgi:RimJ/RimL family protein N-acetyltransferase
MRLRNVTVDDLNLYIGMLCDPVVMAELGGPLPAATVREKLERDAASADADEAWVLAIVPDETAGRAVGVIFVWDSTIEQTPIVEMGWGLLKEFHGRGYGSEAVHLTLLRAKAENRWGVIHAFPGVDNPASNAVCRKNGFDPIGLIDRTYNGHIIHTNIWCVDLASWDPRGFRG